MPEYKISLVRTITAKTLQDARAYFWEFVDEAENEDLKVEKLEDSDDAESHN